MSEDATTAVGPHPDRAAGTPAGGGVSVTRLLAEAASKSGVCWVEVPDHGTWPVWFVWHDDEDPRSAGPAAYVVSGPGEQTLPYLPREVRVVFRSKHTGGRLLTVGAFAEEIPPDAPGWEAAAEVLRAERLNGTGNVLARWRQECVITVLRPHGRPLEEPGSYAAGAGAVRVTPSAGTTATWRPWHWRGRPQRRRGAPG